MPRARMFTSKSLPVFLFAIPWTLFALLWIAGASRFQFPKFEKGEDLFPLFGIPFVLAGFGMLSSPLWAYRQSGKSVYVITNERAIIFSAGFRMTIRSFYPADLKGIYRTERKDGSGDVIMGSTVRLDSNNDPRTTHHGFLNVADAKATEDRLRDLW